MTPTCATSATPLDARRDTSCCDWCLVMCGVLLRKEHTRVQPRFVRLIDALKQGAVDQAAVLHAACEAAAATACIALGGERAEVVWAEAGEWTYATVPVRGDGFEGIFRRATGGERAPWTIGRPVSGGYPAAFAGVPDEATAYADVLATIIDLLFVRDRFAARAFVRRQRLERARVARDIHHGPAQELVTTTMQLDVLDELIARDPARARELAAGARASAVAALEGLRASIADLTPPTTGHTLHPLDAEIEECARRFGVRVSLDVDARDRRLGDEEIELIRSFVEEGISNVRKHARSTRSELHVSVDSNVLHVSIIGPNEHRSKVDPQPGHGLHLMRGYARLFGGDVAVGSDGPSSSLTLQLPM